MMVPQWLRDHWASRQYNNTDRVQLGRLQPPHEAGPVEPLLADKSFNNHSRNDGQHVSPYDTGIVQVGTDGLQVQLLQGVDLGRFQQVLARATRATTGLTAPLPPGRADGLYLDPPLLSPDIAVEPEDWQEMMKGGLQSALESQTVVFEVWGASRALTHQLVRSRRAGFHQQSQRATWYGDRPEVRMPESIWRSTPRVRSAWYNAVLGSWDAYRVACEAGVSYQDARYILPEGTVNYIQCGYTVREFMAVYAYRGCSMFLWEMVSVMRKMREALLFQSPWLEPYIKISCEKGALCTACLGSGKVWPDGIAWDPSDSASFSDNAGGDPVACSSCDGKGSPTRKCTFQGWENPEGQCSFPWARQDNRTFLPNPKFRIGTS